MPKYLIERETPNAVKLSAGDFQGICDGSCDARKRLGSSVQWVQSYVAEGVTYCVYDAPDKEEAIRCHAEKGEFPDSRISETEAVIDPPTAE